jgi:hypothetical protein
MVGEGSNSTRDGPCKGMVRIKGTSTPFSTVQCASVNKDEGFLPHATSQDAVKYICSMGNGGGGGTQQVL